ncbi:hypothetical protein [Bosea sp. BIWAKO-01]|uniref:hypothetical protein n=1 Tax=Bosea sp. BIWAKO-01 TaxID=506668 RepID=UPI000852BEDF|nr:hypothetical protein [Bosea sp. BIWAKO-01]GAU86437.1 hypothetical protein BIWAKO_06385 [Bosea sp. BIWAKO-01]
MSMIREMLLTSDRITVLSGLTMVGDLVRGLVRIVPLVVPTGARPGGIVHLPGAPTAGLHAFRSVLLDYVEEAVATGHVRRLRM